MGSRIWGGESSQTEFDEIIVAAVKEKHETCSTEFLQMGALHGVMQGLVQVVLVDFKKTSEFVSMAAGAQSRPPASAGADSSGKPGSHPAKVLAFLQDHGSSQEMFEDMGAFGMRFLTGSVPVGGILAVPPAFIKAQTIVPGKGHALMLSTPYLSQGCLTRREEYLFVKDSVEIFQKPSETNPVWQLMGKVEKALDAMEAKSPAKAPAATPPPILPRGRSTERRKKRRSRWGRRGRMSRRRRRGRGISSPRRARTPHPAPQTCSILSLMKNVRAADSSPYPSVTDAASPAVPTVGASGGRGHRHGPAAAA